MVARPACARRSYQLARSDTEFDLEGLLRHDPRPFKAGRRRCQIASQKLEARGGRFWVEGEEFCLICRREKLSGLIAARHGLALGWHGLIGIVHLFHSSLASASPQIGSTESGRELRAYLPIISPGHAPSLSLWRVACQLASTAVVHGSPVG